MNGLWTPQSAAITDPPTPQPAALWRGEREGWMRGKGRGRQEGERRKGERKDSSRVMTQRAIAWDIDRHIETDRHRLVEGD